MCVECVVFFDVGGYTRLKTFYLLGGSDCLKETFLFLIKIRSWLGTYSQGGGVLSWKNKIKHKKHNTTHKITIVFKDT